MARYAEHTEVSADRSRSEIERILQRYGASAFAYGWEDGRAMISFKASNRYVRFELPMPDREEFARTPGRGQRRSDISTDKAFDQAVRQRWRALALVIKAKLEAVDTEITTFDQEFLAHTLLPNGQTVGSWAIPQVEEAYENGHMPKLLTAGK